MKNRIIVIVLASVLLAGCAANLAQGPMFDHALEPDPSMATIYFYRGTDVYGIKSLENIPVSDGQRVIGELYRGGYFTYKIKPGTYKFNTVVSGAILDRILEIQLEENKVYFLKSVFRSVFLANTNSLIITPEQEAIDELKNYKSQL